MKKSGLVLEGGAFRGLFTAGALDFLSEKGIRFPYVIGVSTGAINAVSYLSGQAGRFREIIVEASAQSVFGLSKTKMKEEKRALDLVGMLFEYSSSNMPIDLSGFAGCGSECEFSMTDCKTGKAAYVKPGQTDGEIIRSCRAACAIPIMCDPVNIGDNIYMDGGITDSIPVRRALRKCEKAVVILTRREDEEPTDYTRMAFLIDIYYREKFPELADAMMNRYRNYKKQIKYIASAEQDGRAFVIRPCLEGISHFETDRAKIDRFYTHGYETMKANFDRLMEFTGSTV